MKKEFSTRPEVIRKEKLEGFAWEDYVTAIPSPLIVVTSYKSNGMPNATLQSWSTFVSDNSFYCIFASVNKKKHMYETIKQTGHLVINFPSADVYKYCMATIVNNHFEDDEITMSGLTAEKATVVNAPRIKECFLNLECEYVWEKEIHEGDSNVVMCVKIVNVCMEEDNYDERVKGRYGESGYLYNVHNPTDPDTGYMENDSVAILEKLYESDYL